MLGVGMEWINRGEYSRWVFNIKSLLILNTQCKNRKMIRELEIV